MVGTFTKGTLSLSKVTSFAHKVWDARSLLQVSQKDNHTFYFKFNSEASMASILSKGTWYIERKPMLVNAWGTSVGSTKITKTPLCVKFECIPDCYWTREGLSRLASVIGPPICADALTSKLEILPFPKFWVTYTIGSNLPTKIQVVSLDPVTKAKRNEEVLVSYPAKPFIYSGCNSLGHLIGACPTVSRQWRPKGNENRKETTSTTAAGSNTDPNDQPEQVPPMEIVKKDSARVSIAGQSSHVKDVGRESYMDATGCNTPSANDIGDGNGSEPPWQVVGGKRSATSANSANSTNSDESPSPANTFQNLRKVDEIEGKKIANLSKSQLKRLKRNKGRSSPQST